MTRDIDEFKGKNAVIACSSKIDCGNQDCHPEDSYYSINFSSMTEPDCLYDITKPLNDKLKERFEITYVECLDDTAYNKRIGRAANRPNNNGDKGFQNLLDMTKPNGFIVILGCNRYKQPRNSLQNLKYIELPVQNYCGVIIPKDQSLTIDEVNQQIKNNKDLTLLIERIHKKTYIPTDHKFSFCDIKYEDLNSLEDMSPRAWDKPSETETALLAKNKEIPEVTSFYEAINAIRSLPNEVCTIAEFYKNQYRNYTHEFANNLEKMANDFFKLDTDFIKKDLHNFQCKFVYLIKNQEKINCPINDANNDSFNKILLAMASLSAINCTDLEKARLKLQSMKSGESIVNVIDRLDSERKSPLNPYWINSEAKLNGIIAAVLALDKNVDLASEMNNNQSTLYRAINTPGISKISVFGRVNYNNSNSLEIDKDSIVPKKE